MNKDNLLRDLKTTYSEIYSYERKRVEVNRRIRVLNKHLHCLLEFLRREK